MLDAAHRLSLHVARSSGTGFASDLQTYDAVCMCLLRIGEGARLLSDDAKARAPDVPWPDVVNLRHRIAHGYSHLTPGVIWRTATVSVPELASQLSAIRDSLS